jgi:hypothetical protein
MQPQHIVCLKPNYFQPTWFASCKSSLYVVLKGTYKSSNILSDYITALLRQLIRKMRYDVTIYLLHGRSSPAFAYSASINLAKCILSAQSVIVCCSYMYHAWSLLALQTLKMLHGDSNWYMKHAEAHCAVLDDCTMHAIEHPVHSMHAL